MARKRKRETSDGGEAGRGSPRQPGKQDAGDQTAVNAEDRGSGKSSLREWGQSLAIAFILFLIIRTFLLNTFVIISGSMENTLLIGDLLVVNRAATGSRVPGTQIRIPGYSKPKRGDVLVFDPHHEEDMKLIKRLMGLPGDTLEMRAKQLFVNGEALEEPYVQHTRGLARASDPAMAWQGGFLLPGMNRAEYRPTRDDWGPLIVPEGYYFMMGDNRDESYDSRFWGPLATWRIEGRASFIYFSYNRDSYRPFPWLREIRWGRLLDRIH